MKKLFLEADPNQVTLKKLLGKDFLELSMRTVSSANPNRNGSWFTKEGQEKGIASYDDKPILAYFENGDFVSHNGEWKNDSSTGMDFWDTLGSKGERPIGTIRGKDRKEVVFDEKTGLYWTEITCVLWTQYSYRQVKRLIEDAQKAAETGGPTKNISVEVDITDYEELPNGVLKINDYVLQGITILGSRNGRKVEPGIDGAQLSVLDVTSTQLYESQKHTLMQAYEKLDASLQTKEENPMDPKQENLTQTDPENKTAECKTFEGDPNASQVTVPPVDQTTAAQTTSEGQDPENKTFEGMDAEDHKEDPMTHAICDLAWMIDRQSYALTDYESAIKYYEGLEDFPGKKLIINSMKRMAACAKESLSDLSKLLALVTADELADDPEKEEFEAKLAEHCSLPEIYKELEEKDCKMSDMQCKLEEAQKECESLKEACAKQEDECKLCKHELEEVKAEKEKMEFSAFLEKATSAIDAAKGHIGEDIAKALFERCEKKEISSFESLENEIALAAGKAALANPVTNKAYSAPIPTYETQVDDKAAEALSKDPFVRLGYKAKK